MKNILITSAGERVALVEIFRKNAKGMGIDAKVYTTDMDPSLALACRVSDGSFMVPRCSSEDYMQVLQSICIGNHVKVVIPNTERELPILSANKDIFAKLGIHILTPEYDFVMKCIDTHQFGDYIERLDINIKIPQQIDNYETLVDNVFTRSDVAERFVKKYLLDETT